MRPPKSNINYQGEDCMTEYVVTVPSGNEYADANIKVQNIVVPHIQQLDSSATFTSRGYNEWTLKVQSGNANDVTSLLRDEYGFVVTLH